jgi:hypothetical protein
LRRDISLAATAADSQREIMATFFVMQDSTFIAPSKKKAPAGFPAGA